MAMSIAAPTASEKPNQVKASGEMDVVARSRTIGSVRRLATVWRAADNFAFEGCFSKTALPGLSGKVYLAVTEIVSNSGNIFPHGGSLSTLT